MNIAINLLNFVPVIGKQRVVYIFKTEKITPPFTPWLLGVRLFTQQECLGSVVCRC